MSTNISDNLCNLHLIIQLSTACKRPSFSDALIPLIVRPTSKLQKALSGKIFLLTVVIQMIQIQMQNDFIALADICNIVYL